MQIADVIFISAKWTDWNWWIYCFHFCPSVCFCVCLCALTWMGGWRIVRRELYSTRVWKVDNISVRTRYCWKRCLLAFWWYSPVQDRSAF